MDVNHKHLAKTKLFWLVLLIPIFCGATLGVFIAMAEQPLAWCFKAACVQAFFEIYKFPIAIAGVSLPLVAMVAAIHRSIEAALQISYASKQFGEVLSNNRFGNYLKHREGFEKLIEGYCSRRHYRNGCKTIVLTHGVYGKLFPEASFGNVNWNGQFDVDRMANLEKHAKVVVEQYSKPVEEFDCYKFLVSVKFLVGVFSINYAPQRKVTILKDGIDQHKDIFATGITGAYAPVFTIARDSLAVFVLFRSYVGLNGLDYTVRWNFQHLAERLKKSSATFRVADLK